MVVHQRKHEYMYPRNNLAYANAVYACYEILLIFEHPRQDCAVGAYMEESRSVIMFHISLSSFCCIAGLSYLPTILHPDPLSGT